VPKRPPLPATNLQIAARGSVSVTTMPFVVPSLSVSDGIVSVADARRRVVHARDREHAARRDLLGVGEHVIIHATGGRAAGRGAWPLPGAVHARK
jgi:hypothetical protein